MLSTVIQEPEVATVLAYRRTTSGRSDLFVVGPRTRGRYHPSKGVPVCVRVRLRPGQARAAFGVPIRELVDRTVRITDLWGAEGERLTAALASAGSDTELVLSRLNEALGSRTRPADDLVAAAAHELSLTSSPAGAAAQLGVSERHLRNLFAREIGLSPKHFARISRLRRVLDQAGSRRWAALADETGFFDQAHLISDFRAFMGVTPAAYLAGRLPPTTPCADLTRLAPA